MKRFFLLVIGLFFLQGCATPHLSESVLKKERYTKIHTGDHTYFSCSYDNFIFSTTFDAVDKKGNKVQGAICCDVHQKCKVYINES